MTAEKKKKNKKVKSKKDEDEEAAEPTCTHEISFGPCKLQHSFIDLAVCEMPDPASSTDGTAAESKSTLTCRSVQAQILIPWPVAMGDGNHDTPLVRKAIPWDTEDVAKPDKPQRPRKVLWG